MELKIGSDLAYPDAMRKGDCTPGAVVQVLCACFTSAVRAAAGDPHCAPLMEIGSECWDDTCQSSPSDGVLLRGVTAAATVDCLAQLPDTKKGTLRTQVRQHGF